MILSSPQAFSDLEKSLLSKAVIDCCWKEDPDLGRIFPFVSSFSDFFLVYFYGYAFVRKPGVEGRCRSRPVKSIENHTSRTTFTGGRKVRGERQVNGSKLHQVHVHGKRRRPQVAALEVLNREEAVGFCKRLSCFFRTICEVNF